METLFTILPFLAIILISLNAYYRYKNRGKEQEQIWTDKYSFTRDIMTAFKRAKYRPWTFLFYFPWFFGIVIGFASLVGNIERLIYPPLPLEQMETKQGTIESIKERKKIDDLLVLKTNAKMIEEYSYREGWESKNNLIGKNVTIFYGKGFNSAFTIDNKVYQIVDNNTHEVIKKYSYEGALKTNIDFWKFTIWSFVIGFLSGFIMWYANRKELPVHKLNKIKMDAKEKERKK